MIHIFIINPFAGDKTFADDLRTKLSSLNGLDYFVFNTRYSGYEAELVKKIQNIFNGEKLRFYCCGGSGTMRNMLNGFENLSEAEVAFFPCGLTNDFLKSFGKDEERFHQIEELINGEVIKVDYIKTNHGVSLNTLSTGLDSNTIEKMNDFRILRLFGKALPYTMAIIHAIFVSKPIQYEVVRDNSPLNGKFAEVFIGNGCIFGGNLHFAESTCVNDGKGIYCIAGNKRGFTMLPIISALTGRKYKKLSRLTLNGSISKVSIRRTDGKTFTINQDGDLIKNIDFCEAEIVHKGLSFVIPRGVRL